MKLIMEEVERKSEKYKNWKKWELGGCKILKRRNTIKKQKKLSKKRKSMLSQKREKGIEKLMLKKEIIETWEAICDTKKNKDIKRVSNSYSFHRSSIFNHFLI